MSQRIVKVFGDTLTMIKGFNVDIYGCEVSFAWNTHPKELSAFLDKYELGEDAKEQFFSILNESSKAGAITIQIADTVNNIVVFFEEPNNKVVAHELYHVACRIMEDRNIKEEESWAYLIGYLTEMFYDLYLEESK